MLKIEIFNTITQQLAYFVNKSSMHVQEQPFGVAYCSFRGSFIILLLLILGYNILSVI